MAATPKKLYIGQPGTTIATLYTAPASTTAIVKNIILSNTGSTSATVTVNFVPSGGTAAAANQVLSSYPVNAYDTITIDMAGVLETGDSLQALQDTSGAITVFISGVEVA